ncbi:MAG: helix-turn-helix domain-containing protein, partial [Verrucomicrobia bacterium]|nr:helix-turn-helix domain-containing protein [Verrucomicrobiota bacterium]
MTSAVESNGAIMTGSMSDEEKWSAVISKNAGADGKFYYSVRTTGVYCRPSCPSRAALRRNITFYDTADEAEKAGFRPCKRCRPKGPSKTAIHEAAVARACRLIESAEREPRLAELAKAAGVSHYYFHRLFKAVTGVTPKEYAIARRNQRIRRQLIRSNSVTEAIYDAGFNSSGRFYANSTQTLGMTPTTFRKGGTGMRIRFAVGECSLGSILVAASDKGVCAISFGDDPEILVRDLQDRFPRAELIGADR